MMDMYTIFGIFFLLVLMQLIGMRLQVRAYHKAIRRLHRQGNVGIGGRRGKLGPGYVIIIACDNEGMMVDSEIMKGMTIFSHFKKEKDIVGKHISQLKQEYMDLSKSKQKFYKGYIQALDALEQRLELPGCQEV